MFGFVKHFSQIPLDFFSVKMYIIVVGAVHERPADHRERAYPGGPRSARPATMHIPGPSPTTTDQRGRTPFPLIRRCAPPSPLKGRRPPPYKASPPWGNCAFAPPGAEEAKAEFPQRSENRRISVSPNGFPGTARWIVGPYNNQSCPHILAHLTALCQPCSRPRRLASSSSGVKTRSTAQLLRTSSRPVQ